MVYLIHLSRPFKHAQHYIGFVEGDDDVEKRLAKHSNGSGSRFLRAVRRAGIDFIVARMFPGYTRTQERRLKNHKKSRLLCPICNPKAHNRGNFKEE
jgi:predicted GIY-YIG superfamily endonuclease